MRKTTIFGSEDPNENKPAGKDKETVKNFYLERKFEIVNDINKILDNDVIITPIQVIDEKVMVVGYEEIDKLSW